MDTSIRSVYNEKFTPEAYENIINELNSRFDNSLKFRICETPVFLTDDFKVQLEEASKDIIGFLARKDLKDITNSTLTPQTNVPGEDEGPLFLCVDFAIAEDENGNPSPRLIELQGFPSLFGYYYMLQKLYRKYQFVPESYTPFFNNLTEEEYIARFKSAVLGNCEPEEVIILEIEPEEQGTAIDFKATQELIGVEAVCISKLIKKDGILWYPKGDTYLPVKRIYNRVIFDELFGRDDLNRAFNMIDADIKVEWAGHPNWYSRISKFCLPFIESKYVPESYFVQDFPADKYNILDQYVLKPLYSFSGSGVKLDVLQEDIDEIFRNKEQSQWLLQRKETYIPAILAPDGSKAKAEIRLLYIQDKSTGKPELVFNLARLTKGAMIGVKYNKGQDWVGSSMCFFRKD